MTSIGKLPDFYNPAMVDKIYTPNIQAALAAGLALREELKGEMPRWDEMYLQILVDGIVDFLSGEIGTFFVPNSGGSLKNFIEDGYRNVHLISMLFLACDRHKHIHISSPLWWRNAIGNTPMANSHESFITVEDILSRKWIPQYYPNETLFYAEKMGGIPIFPIHALDGMIGADFMPSVQEFISFWFGVSGLNPTLVYKGMPPVTEHLGAFQACVEFEQWPETKLNKPALEMVMHSPKTKIGGFTAEYCNGLTALQIVDNLKDFPEVLKRVEFVLRWTTMFAPEANKEMFEQLLGKLTAAGIKVV